MTGKVVIANIEIILPFHVEMCVEKIDQFLYDIYGNNENFQTLRKHEESVQEYGHAYELRETLLDRMIVEEGIFLSPQTEWDKFCEKKKVRQDIAMVRHRIS